MDLQSAVKEYEQAVRKEIASEKAHQLNKRKFEEGMINALDLQNSANQLAKAKAEKTGMHVQYLMRKKTVGYYKGEKLITEKN